MELLKGAALLAQPAEALCSDSEDTQKHVLSIAVSQRCSAGALLFSVFFFYNIYYCKEKGVCLSFYRFTG